MATATKYNREGKWGRSSRFYDCPDGGHRVSVTSVLQALNKPALINWAAKAERELVTKVAGDLFEDAPAEMSKANFLLQLGTRLGKEKAHQKLLKQASDIGTEAHAMIEWTLRKELKQEVGPEPKLSEKALWAFMAWEDWRKKANMVPLQIEQVVWSQKYGYAGTLDLLCELDLPTGDRGVVVMDNKSGKAIYPESSLQIAAYVAASIEMGLADVHTSGMVLRLPKVESDPDFEVKFIPCSDMSSLLVTFRAALHLWKWMDASGAL